MFIYKSLQYTSPELCLRLWPSSRAALVASDCSKQGDWQSAAFFFIIMEAKGTARIADAEDSPLPAWLYDDRENKYMKPVPVGKRKIKTDLNGSFKVWMWGSVEGAGSHDLLNGTTKPSSPEDGLICGTTSAAFMKSCFSSYYIQDIIPKT